MFNLENGIPSYKLVKITNGDNQNKDIVKVPLILEDELSIKVSSKYGELWESSPNNFMNLLSNSFGLPSGQFALQGVQIWQSTDPIDISFTVHIEMDTDSYKDVIEPVIALMETVLPKKGSNAQEDIDSQTGLKKAFSNLKLKTLIPPGPNLQSIWSAISGGEMDNGVGKLLAKFNKGENGVYNVKIGYANLNNVIIKSIDPSFSSEVSYSNSQKEYYPVSASLNIEITTMEIATKEMIENIFKKNIG